MRYLSVCSGIEAASVAWKPLGWQCGGLSEIEPFPRAVLQQRFDAVPVDWDHRHSPQSNVLPLFGGFIKIEAHHVGPIDLLVGGTPCQSFSVAGKRLGLDDPRGNLTLEFLALARRVRPRWIVWENVPGILSHDNGRTMGTFLWLLGELGYRWAYRVLDAQFVRVGGFDRAVPQRRRRVFVVGYLGNDARAQTVLFDRESLRGDYQKGGGLRQSEREIVGTITTRTGRANDNYSAECGHCIVDSGRPRWLTPRECERLQGIPDDWTNIDWRGKRAADGPRYKAIGNSMAVNCLRWLGERISMVERIMEPVE